ncbi:hypothetical protein AGMMS50212_14970 [Spirochaetia bacterium]|nr:hypothetical protein AGMMS50212_14970 [Spirochaetia bacterium]
MKKIFCILICVFLPFFAAAQNGGAAEEVVLPLKKAGIFSSGVGYFEHSGSIAPNASIMMSFNQNAVNDALKSLVINDPEASSPQVNYASESTLYRTLRSLKIDLSGSPSIADILRSLRGEEIQVTTSNMIVAPAAIGGRIVAVEDSGIFLRDGEGRSPAVSLATPSGIRIINTKDIQSFNFKDPAITADLNRALDLINNFRDSQTRTLEIALSGARRRNVSISYVIPAPVWKVSYRLDLNKSSPFLQGWAIIDNDGDTDWIDVELSLITGRPVSFVQNLYPPYYTARPVLPLAIAGVAEAATYESGYSGRDMATNDVMMEYKMADEAPRLSKSLAVPSPMAPSIAGGIIPAATGSNAGDQFEFTIKKPVTLLRRQSAMLPLVEGSVLAQKTLVFQGAKAQNGVSIHPAISAELTNNTGMKLPAGPITVFDSGTYAGDALIEFFPENEKRIISYGDDLSVTGSVNASNSRVVAAVKVSKGVMTINRKVINEKKYTIRNASAQAKKIIIEHPITQGASLTSPSSSYEQTSSLYRFSQNLSPNGTLDFTVKEESPLAQTVALGRLNADSFISYSTNDEMPLNIRQMFEKLIGLKKASDTEKKALSDLEEKRERLVSDQERIRNNLSAAGNTSDQGLEYLNRLTAMDAEIDAQNEAIETQRSKADQAEKDYDKYLNTIEL